MAGVKQLTIIIFTDRADRIFHQSLLSAAIAEQLIIFDQETSNDWPALKKELLAINPDLKIRIIPRQGPITDFAKLRNQAIKLVKTQWLLFLDSDEILELPSLNYLKNLLQSKVVVAYTITRYDYFAHRQLRFGETGGYQAIRLAKTNSISYRRPVHERAFVKGLVRESDLVIKHFSHKNISQFFSDVSYYAKLEAEFRDHEQAISKTALILQTLIFPGAKFIYNYILCWGILDGFAGLIYAVLMSGHSLLVRILLYEQLFIQS